jgi:hypothetical protein
VVLNIAEDMSPLMVLFDETVSQCCLSEGRSSDFERTVEITESGRTAAAIPGGCHKPYASPVRNTDNTFTSAARSVFVHLILGTPADCLSYQVPIL